jgi:antitoxin (DNA-binding transcriptional repressor) of toxin-antitoxin stability system
MHQVTIHEAKTHLSRLIQEALSGEEVVVARGRTPLVKISALRGASVRRRFGSHPGFITRIAADFDEPLDDFREYSK